MLPEGGKFIEVGAWKGKSLVYLYDRIEDLGKRLDIIAVDTFKGDDETGRTNVLPDFVNNIGERKIHWHEMDSRAAAEMYLDGELDGVFIDAAHDYENCKADIAAWLPKVKEGGFIGGHDADSEGVQKALSEFDFEYATAGRCWVKLPKEKP